MHIIFARHGESTANTDRVITNRGYTHGLTDTGRAQAVKLAESLEDSGAVALYTSPLKRAVETAQILGERLGLEHEVVSALQEIDCGVLEGRSDDEAWHHHARIAHEWYVEENENYAPEGGESLSTVRQRFERLLARLETNHPDQIVICVGHGGLYRAMIPETFGVDAELDYAESVYVDTMAFKR